MNKKELEEYVRRILETQIEYITDEDGNKHQMRIGSGDNTYD